MSPQALKARKGEETRAQILDAAVQQASEAGFESLTIGTLAEHYQGGPKRRFHDLRTAGGSAAP